MYYFLQYYTGTTYARTRLNSKFQCILWIGWYVNSVPSEIWQNPSLLSRYTLKILLSRVDCTYYVGHRNKKLFFGGGGLKSRGLTMHTYCGSQKISPVEILTIPGLLMLRDAQKSETAYPNSK
jgi:hypothetical protein